MNKKLLTAGITAVFGFALTAAGQTGTGTSTTSSTFAPTNFGDMVLTVTPSNATGSSGTSTVYGSNGTSDAIGTGGSFVNSSQFNYTVTGPNTATIVTPASGSTPSSTTTLVFSSATGGSYSTTSGGVTTTGNFKTAAIPSAVPIGNVSVRTTLMAGDSATIGFVVDGTMPRKVLLRAVGPGLAAFGIKDGVADPQITLYKGSQTLAMNDNWGTAEAVTTNSTSSGSGTSLGSSTGSATSTGSASGTSTGTGTSTAISSGNGNFNSGLATADNFTQVGAFGLTSGGKDAAMVVTLDPGAYTMMVQASTSGTTATGTGTSTGSNSGTSTGNTSTGSTGTTTGSTGTGTSTGSTGSTATNTGSTGTTTGSTGVATGSTATGSTATGSTATSAAAAGEILAEVYFVD